ncbi:MAG: UDP-glucose/GDP-mannose dehydrogenase family protein [Candidatus Nitrosopelagicus sp.]|nr:UDP-glucose/GDP-mannose dehydrogenase family protein [Candidatus Nitrosopelagicus sp.]
MKITIVGLGFVGLSLTSVLASKGNNILGIDVDEKKCEGIRKGISPFFEPELEKLLRHGLKKKLEISTDFSLIKNSDIIFVTVGTPQKSNGSIELSMIKNAVKAIGKILKNDKKNPIIFIKSTVTPGTMQETVLPILEKESGKKAGKDFGLISNPEFLQESTAIKDTKFPHVIVLGGYETKYMKIAKKFFSKIHPGIPIIVTNHQTAEMIKYANNSFLATKISFINQLSNICQNIPGANIDDVAKTIGLDPRIGKLFLNAGPGYGGSCLPKDMKALINFAGKVGINPRLLNAVEQTNKKQIQNIIQLIEKTLGNLKGKHITILGTAFKPNTDDIRDSIAIELIKKLLKKQVILTVYDPKAMKNTEKLFGEKIKYANSVSNSLKNSHCAIIMVYWKQFESINNNSIDDMKRKFIIDCRRVLSEKKLSSEYHAIGIGRL